MNRCVRPWTVGLLLALALALLASCSRKKGPEQPAVAQAIRAVVEPARPHARPAVANERLHALEPIARFYRARAFEAAWSRDASLLPQARALVDAITSADREGLTPSDYHLARIAALMRVAPEQQYRDNLKAQARALGDLDVLLTDAFFLYGSHLADGKVNVETGEPRWNGVSQQVDLVRLLGEALDSGRVKEKLQSLLPRDAEYARLRALRASWLGQAGGDRRALERRTKTLALNMERWRWLPNDDASRYVLVDVAAFELAEFDNGRELARMKIVVGLDTWQTPDFTSAMSEVVLNPYWNAPRHVLVTELINYMKADINYLASNKMVLLRKVGDREDVLDPTTIDFANATPANIDFRLRQDPGPLNVLGRLKFNLPNKYDVYLHDTPYQEDFGKPARMASHGCVRVEKPIDFALFLLGARSGWTRERIAAEIDRLQERTIRLSTPVVTHVAYFTAWVTAGGVVEFRNDVYARDGKLDAALHTPPPNGVGPSRASTKAARLTQ